MGKTTALRRSADYLRIQEWADEHEKEIARSFLNKRYAECCPDRYTDLRAAAICLTVESYYAQEKAGWRPRVFIPGFRRPDILRRDLVLAYLNGRWCPEGLKPVEEPWNATRLSKLGREFGGEYPWCASIEPNNVRNTLSRIQAKGFLTPLPEPLRIKFVD